MFRKILAAIDGSAASMKTLMEAKRMAVFHHATLRIIYADSEDVDQEAGLELLAQAQSAVGEGVEVETRVVHANAIYGLNGITEAIAHAVNEWGADLVVVGSSNRRGLERLVIGSVAEQLIAKVDASVLLVRPVRRSVALTCSSPHF
jgi:nucleotide-binding universal stress UspA family protein